MVKTETIPVSVFLITLYNFLISKIAVMHTSVLGGSVTKGEQKEKKKRKKIKKYEKELTLTLKGLVGVQFDTPPRSCGFFKNLFPRQWVKP